MPNWEGDSSVKAAIKWFLEFMESSVWEKNKEKIKQHLQNVLRAQKSPSLPPLESDSSRVLYPYDKFSWYLFLAHSYNYELEYYDFSQGARVVPIFSIIGQHLDLLQKTPGVEQLVQRLFNSERNFPDGPLFELLVGLVYLRNHWKRVTFLQPIKSAKTPDILVESSLKYYFIECKKLSKSSSYSEKERKIWLKMSQPLRQYFVDKRKSFIVDIVFHVELELLDQNLIENTLLPKLDLIASKGTIIENDVWTVSVDFVNFNQIKKHMRKFRVKYPSSSLIELIFNKFEPGRGYSPVFECNARGLSTTYLENIYFAAGAVWSCDAKESINKKSRHILRHIAEACSQLPDGKPGNIHIGLESHDGYLVEETRFNKIMHHICAFEAKGKEMHWVYCHIFDPRTPPDDNWDFGETVLSFKSPDAGVEPLSHSAVALPDYAEQKEGVFWHER